MWKSVISSPLWLNHLRCGLECHISREKTLKGVLELLIYLTNIKNFKIFQPSSNKIHNITLVNSPLCLKTKKDLSNTVEAPASLPQCGPFSPVLPGATIILNSGLPSHGCFLGLPCPHWACPELGEALCLSAHSPFLLDSFGEFQPLGYI